MIINSAVPERHKRLIIAQYDPGVCTKTFFRTGQNSTGARPRADNKTNEKPKSPIVLKPVFIRTFRKIKPPVVPVLIENQN
jgi:hypothetical protein